MAIVLKTPKIVINSVDLTNYIDSISIDEKYDDVETTAFGQNSKTYVAGLGDHKVSLEFLQDFALSTVEATIYPLLSTVTSMSVRALSSATSTTNPAYTFSVLVDEWMPVDGKVGDLSKASVSWPISGDIVKSFA